ncbi:uncharacterized protein SCHCODRAFT_02612546 [Schizophyllum commune H4-8]|uniref:C2H2-type domain-containing protein n=1 Tax=Schizophyllum commune (strain H4-8 / FGSC 9210) TaxID=578458 RepID=D8PNK9_SCHCM|nr:uncharacterized protein SCHCODRAFT_02612546 [Schizophyllum commune H4-8]KAI5898584.1 hypothetical protein SCHCODRAFT_02612546 [Schizophyllum commune H4-8]
MSSQHNTPFDTFDGPFAKQQQPGFDFFSFQSPSDILAPHPDLFELELDSSLAGVNEVQLQLLAVDSNDAFNILRSDTPTCGPPSAITVSSESGYDSLSSRSESVYYGAHSAYESPHSNYGSNYSFRTDHSLEYDQRMQVDAMSEYTGAQMHANSGTMDPAASLAALPNGPQRGSGGQLERRYTKGFETRTSFSDYGSPRRSSMHPEYYAQQQQMAYNVPQIPMLNQHVEDMGNHSDPRKKYKCPACPRGFARAYNLKTHMATHDPNRLKPHVCPHHNCGRSFSRKHDLGRHLVSIHRQNGSEGPSAVAKKAIGVDKGPRGWCDDCGKGWVGSASTCECHDDAK